MKREKKEKQVRRVKTTKRIKAQRAKPPTVTWATDAFIGIKTEVKTEEEKERNWEQVSHPATLDHLVAYRAYGGPILSPLTHRGNIIIIIIIKNTYPSLYLKCLNVISSMNLTRSS